MSFWGGEEGVFKYLVTCGHAGSHHWRHEQSHLQMKRGGEQLGKGQQTRLAIEGIGRRWRVEVSRRKGALISHASLLTIGMSPLT